MIKKLLLLTVLAITVAGLAHADPVTFATATTLGCFSGSSCTPSSSTASTTDLSFSGSSFGPQVATAGSLAITLGTFTLSDSASAWIDKDFNGLVTFTMPSVITGSNQAQFNAEVTGLVLKDAFGLVYIDFNNSPLQFTFKNDTYAGSFSFSVDDLFFGVAGSGGSNPVNWTGHITNAQQTKLAATSVPEPSSLFLLGGGALGMFGRLRKRLLN